MDFRNATYNAFGTIDCEVNHPAYGWIPFTASPNDVEPLGLAIFAAAKDQAQPYAPPAVDLEALALEVRSKRNALLSESDWTQIADAPVNQAAWATYRQGLRDVPQQAGFPQDVVWPTKP